MNLKGYQFLEKIASQIGQMVSIRYLILPNRPLVSNALLELLESWGLDLTSDQIGVVPLALSLPPEKTLSLTSIRRLGTTSTREVRELADQLITNEVLELVGTSHFRLSDQIRTAVTPEVNPDLARMLSEMTGEMSRAEIMAQHGFKDEKPFRENYQQYGINQGLIEMTRPASDWVMVAKRSNCIEPVMKNSPMI